MAKETIIDSQTARRLLLILSLEGDVKREEIEWALGIIHQIPGYAGITLTKAVQDKPLKDILVAIAAEQLSPTTPKDLETLIEEAKKREAALKAAKETGEKRAEEFIEAAEKAAKTKAPTPGPETAAPPPPPEEPVSFGIKITPAALKAFGESVGKATTTPFKLVSFFSPPKILTQAPQTTAALASAMSLSQISAKAEGLPEVERKQLLRFVENLREAEFSFYAQVKLQRTPVPVRAVTILLGSEFGMTQGEVVALVHGGAPSEKGPSFIGGIGQQIFGGLAQKAVTKAATKAVTSALTKTGISVTTKVVAGGIGKVIGGLIGTAGGPVGTAIGVAVGWVVDKVVGPLINKVVDFISKNKWVLAAPFVLAGLLFGLPWLAIGGVALGGFLLAGGVGPALSMAGGLTSSAISGITSLVVASIATPLIVALISIPVLVAIILFIINSGAYLVPPFTAGGAIPEECQGEGPEKPEAKGVLFSNDGRYAYPLAPAGSVGEDCTHWDKTLATDIFPIGGNGLHTPVIAYTSGVVHETSTTDPKGGKYIILRGGDGRYYYYAHNCALYVRPGQGVSAGEVIATTDKTGSAAKTPEHLHFAISNFPRFQEGGTVCPSEDFADRFSSYNRCPPEKRCVP